MLAGWRVGDSRTVVVVVVICTGQKLSREGASRVASVVAFWPHRDHNYRASGKRTSTWRKHVSRNLWLCVNSECGWLARGGRTPHSERSWSKSGPKKHAIGQLAIDQLSICSSNLPHSSHIPTCDLHLLPIPILHSGLRRQINMDTQAPKSTHL